jgi:hypothetical protein
VAERRVVQGAWACGSRARRAAPCRAGPVRAGAGGRRAGKRAFIPPMLFGLMDTWLRQVFGPVHPALARR